MTTGKPKGGWMRRAPGALPGIEARFSGRAYAPHRHDTYAIGLTLEGVQSFDYRGAARHSLPGRLVVIHPDELHDGRAGDGGQFRYRTAYISPAGLQTVLGGRALPFIEDGAFLHGLFACAWALKAGNIWGVMGWHSAWNWLLAVGFELPVTGLDAHVPALLVQLLPRGPEILTGGAEGPEGSVLCVALLAIWSAILIWRRWRAIRRPAG